MEDLTCSVVKAQPQLPWWLPQPHCQPRNIPLIGSWLITNNQHLPKWPGKRYNWHLLRCLGSRHRQAKQPSIHLPCNSLRSTTRWAAGMYPSSKCLHHQGLCTAHDGSQTGLTCVAWHLSDSCTVMEHKIEQKLLVQCLCLMEAKWSDM